MNILVSLWRGLGATALLVAIVLPHSAYAQNVADNINPVGSVCMADQPCVGATAGDAGSRAMPAASTAAVAEVVEDAAEMAAEVATEGAAAVSDFDPAGVYQMNCFACHGTGAAGAPMLGDSEAWDARMEKGMQAVMANAINGVGAMPARGICMSCSDDELQQVVEYMLAQ
ncbi:MAG: c-type cytochrome [Pseudohongiellaceae bacterium]